MRDDAPQRTGTGEPPTTPTPPTTPGPVRPAGSPAPPTPGFPAATADGFSPVTATGDAPAAAPAPAPSRAPRPDRPVVLITGASSGIGEAAAARLAAAGWRLLLSGTDRPRLDAVADRTGGAALAEDLSTPDGPDRLAERALAAAGRVDALVASAGLGWRGPYDRTPPDLLDRMVEVNLTAPMRLVRHLLPGMLERRRGRIVLLGSMAGQVGVRDEAAYAATKGGLTLFAESLWYELRGTGVGVRIILPGAVDTPFFHHRGTPYQRGRPRPVPPERVADTVMAALTGTQDRIFVPRWLAGPARIHGAAPGVFRRMASRFG
ncbi:SDR family NAD(P)-dependent oxidoreductase [Kitasatospora camelliae]|uniref:SDR family oxidoreductase n=1 Tax=Kitasatospora camelliae TaxID=3156397 RepID=A0AAU8JRZ7_9ACTN